MYISLSSINPSVSTSSYTYLYPVTFFPLYLVTLYFSTKHNKIISLLSPAFIVTLSNLCSTQSSGDQSGRGGVVFVSIDDIGLTNYDVGIIRDLLADFKKETGCRSINIMSIHNHASIDTVGFWGPLPRSGRNKKYMEMLRQKVKQVVIDAYNDRREGDLYYGKKEAEEIQRDSRLPEVDSKDVTRFRFVPKDGSREVWMINFASHTESLLGKNSYVSADFAGYLRNEILEKTGAETIYFVGGADQRYFPGGFNLSNT